MLTPAQLERASVTFDKKLHEAENEIFIDIIRRIKANGMITRTADWQINRLHEFGVLQSEIDRVLKEKLNITEDELRELYDDVAQSGYAFDEAIYSKVGLIQVPYEQNELVKQLLNSSIAQTKGEIQNLTQSLGIATIKDGKKEYKSLTKYYQDTLDKTVNQIAIGATDYNTAIKKASMELSNSGLRRIEYESGYSNRVDVAVRRAVMTGLTQLTGHINDMNAEKLGTEYFEVEFHFGARPTHQPWQGRVWSKKELVTVCGLGEVTGLLGVNCYHTYYPFIPGVSVRTYTDEQLDEMNKKMNEVKEYNGKGYTEYEALQRQRQIETKLRAVRQRITLLKEGQADDKTITAERSKYRALNAEYKQFSAFMGLPEKRQRIYVDGLGRV